MHFEAVELLGTRFEEIWRWSLQCFADALFCNTVSHMRKSAMKVAWQNWILSFFFFFFNVALWTCVGQQYCYDSVNSSSPPLHHVHSVWRLKRRAAGTHWVQPWLYCIVYLCICKDCAHSVLDTIHLSSPWILCFAEGALCIILILMCDYLFGNIYNRRCLSAV